MNTPAPLHRRTLLKHTGMAGVLAAATAPAVHALPALRWRMAASLPKSLDVLYGSGETFARVLRSLSGGKFEVSVHAAGELMPAFGVLDGVQQGTVEMGLTAAYYYTGKDPAFVFGCAIPFGLTARQMDAWMDYGGGREMMDAFYADYKVKSFSAGNSGTQMGGWYRREISEVKDLQGLKMRMGGGIFGETMLRMGVVPQNLPPGEVYQSLEKGALDAVEFVGPHDDQKLGFNKVAPYYYYPGWWEGGPEMAFYINTKAWAGLSAEYKAMVEAASRVAAREVIARYDMLNPIALKKLVSEGTKLRAFSKEILDKGFETAQQVLAEHEAKSPTFRKMLRSMRDFQREQTTWERFSEQRYSSYMATVRF